MKTWQVVFLLVLAIAVIVVLGAAGFAAYLYLQGPVEPPPEVSCAELGQMCGGIADIQCCGGLVCLYDGKLNAQYPDQSGVCAVEALKPDEPPVEPPDPCRVQIPDLVGLGSKEAEMALKGLQLNLTNTPVCAQGKGDRVLSQSPAAGSIVACGEMLFLTYADPTLCPPEPCEAQVPDVVGMSLLEARKAMSEANLILVERARCGAEEKQGKVQQTNPGAGNVLTCGDDVIVYYTDSTLCPPPGPCEVEVEVPDVLGKHYTVAAGIIRQAGLTPVVTQGCYRWVAPDDTVCRIDPPAGTTVACEAEVKIIYCPRSQGIAVPNLIGMTAEDAKKALEQSGFYPIARESCYPMHQKDGRVYETSPRAGQWVHKGREIVYFYCPKGEPCTTALPSGILVDVQSAAENLRESQLVPVLNPQCGPAQENGIVHSFEVRLPEPYDPNAVPCGTEVVLNYTDSNLCPPPQPCEVEVPHVLGKHYTVAAEIIRQAGLTPVAEEGCSRWTAPDDTICRIDPPAGTTVACEAEVKIIYCPRSQGIAVPNLIGMTAEDAKRTLEQGGFYPIPNAECCPSCQKDGRVYKTFPQAGEWVLKGRDVSYYYCPQPAKVKVPDVRWMTPEQAAETVRKAGLNPDLLQVNAYNCSTGDGKAYMTIPAIGTEVDAGSTVSISWCHRVPRPDEVEVPDVMDMPWRDAEKKLKDAGLTPVVHAHCGGGDMPNGLIHTQSPMPQQIVQQGSKVDIYFCPLKVEVPNVMGIAFEDARRMLQDAGLQAVVKINCCGSCVANDLVHTCVPAVGQMVDPMTEVEIYYCPKEEPCTTPLPPMVGLHISVAAENVRNAKLVPVLKPECGPSHKNGIVLRFSVKTPTLHDPAAVPCGTEIELYYYDVKTCPPQKIETFGAYEEFEHGFAFWRQDTGEIYILRDTVGYDTWTRHQDTWQQGVDQEYPCLNPGAKMESPPWPRRGIGKVWCSLGPRPNYLGWATTREQGYDMTIYVKDHVDHVNIYVIGPNGRVFVLQEIGDSRFWFVSPDPSQLDDLKGVPLP